METTLLAVTVGSVLVALLMSAAAWRLSRAERTRASARVAALAAAASQVEGAHERRVPESPVIATAPPTTARVSVFPPARHLPMAAAERVPDLELNPQADEIPSVNHADPPLRSRPIVPVVASAPVTESFLGVASREPSSGGQRGLAVAAAILLIVVGGGAFWALPGDKQSAGEESAVASPTAVPLELISLRHERQGARLTLSGLVRNPAGGTPIEGLTAVVFLFDAQGGFITSARAGVDFKRLSAGDESPFVITVDAPSNVARYRVSFRTDSGVVAHVDRRAEQPIATVIASGTK